MSDSHNELEIIDAYYVNEDRTNIEVLRQNKNGDIYPELITEDINDILYQKLLEEGWSRQRLLRNTYDRNESLENSLKDFVITRYPPEKVYEIQEKIIEIENSSLDFFDLINNELEDEDLFRLKIAIFETPFMKNSRDKAIKSKIRTSKNALEIISMYHNAIQNS